MVDHPVPGATGENFFENGRVSADADPALGDTVEAFAADLRQLRHETGDRTLAALASGSGVSKSVVADALNGRKLPTERTVRALVSFFGADAVSWLARRDALAGVVPAPSSTPGQPAPERRMVPLGRAVVVMVVVAVLAAVISGVTVRALSVPTPVAAAPAASTPAVVPPGASSPSTAAPGARSIEGSITVTTGTDPAKTDCVKDAITAAQATRARGTLLELKYSAACDAVWARITRTDDKALGESVSAAVFEKAAPTASDRQTTTEPDVQSAYTTLLVRPSPEIRVCASGSITVDGATVSLGDPICV